MRYDDYDDYNSRSSRGSSSSRRGSSYSSGRDYDRDYDRDYYRDRDYRGDYGREYDRSYYERDRYSDRYGDRYNDRYSTRSSRGWYDDFDRSDWERTAPNWEDHSGSRKKRPSSSGGSGRSSSRSSQGSSRGGSGRSGSGRSSGGSRSSQSSRNGGRRPSDSQRRNGRQDQRRSSNGNGRRGAIQILPIVVGLVVIILAALVIRSMLGGASGYEIQVASSIVVGETATATLTGSDSNGLSSASIEWTSKDNNVVSVEGDGATCTLTAESLGRATIVVSVDGETVANKTVEVVQTAEGVSEIRVSQDSITIRSGETYTIDATVVMESDEYPTATIKWSSNDTSVAKVDDSGVITAQEVGKAIIKGVAGTKTVEIAVEVVENPNSTPHDSTQDAGQAPEEGTQTDTNTNTGTGTNNGTSTGTGTGTTDTNTGTGTNTGTTGTGTGTGTTDTGTTGTDTGTTGTDTGTTDTGTTGTNTTGTGE